jgi:hypothetical protein
MLQIASFGQKNSPIIVSSEVRGGYHPGHAPGYIEVRGEYQPEVGIIQGMLPGISRLEVGINQGMLPGMGVRLMLGAC